MTARRGDGRDTDRGDITVLLRQLKTGAPNAFSHLIDCIYPVLRRIAQHHLRREHGGHVLQPTALVNEAYLRLVSHAEHDWNNRAHFYGAASEVMRRVLVDYARAAKAHKRGDGDVLVEIDAVRSTHAPRIDLLALDEALDALDAVSPRQARIVQLRFFGGLTVPEISEVLGVTARTVDRDWATARAWLRLRLQERPDPRVERRRITGDA